MEENDLRVRLRFRAVRENLARVRAVVETVLLTEGTGVFTTEDVRDILLGLQEALSNVSRHAYGGDTEPLVDLRVWASRGRFRARLVDRGDPFDPDAVPPPDPDRPREHGYGLYLLQRTMDRVRWGRRWGVNILLLERAGRGETES